MKCNILILTNLKDFHSDSIVELLNINNQKVFRLNVDDLGKYIFDFNIHKNSYKIYDLFDRCVDLSIIKSIFVGKANINYLFFKNGFNSVEGFKYKEIASLLLAISKISKNTKWMDKPENRFLASNKIFQLETAKECGFIIPKTIITNSFNQVDKFIKENKSIIYKTLYVPLVNNGDNTTSMINTTLIDFDLEKYKTSIELCPCIFQENIDKYYELRINVIGNKIVAVKINSQINNLTLIDWRIDQFNLQYEEIKINNNIENKILKFMKLLKINFGIFDFIYTKSKKYVFLEVNPIGSWLWYKDSIESNISQIISEWLI